jgi:hypothetical protein
MTQPIETDKKHNYRDIAWKKAIIAMAKYVLQFCMTDLANNIDDSKEINGLSQVSLPRPGSDTDKNTRYADVLLVVPIREDEDYNVVCLIEQQHEHDSNFLLRVFESFMRLRVQSQSQRTTAFVIYTGNSEPSNSYSETCYGSKLSFEFRTINLKSLNIDELKTSNNPFAMVLYAGILSLDKDTKIETRLRHFSEIIEIMALNKFSREQQLYVLDFAINIFYLTET